MIFGGGVRPEEPDPLWLLLLNAVRMKPGVKRGELTEKLKHKGNAEAVGEGLSHLKANGLAYHQEVQPEGGGRPAECWYPSGSSDDTGGQPDPEPEDADPWTVVPEAPAERPRQETYSADHAAEVSFLAGGGPETNPPPTRAAGVSFLADAPGASGVAAEQRRKDGVSSEKPSPVPEAESTGGSEDDRVMSEEEFFATLEAGMRATRRPG